MRGIWRSARWELAESELLNGRTLIFLGLWAIYDLASARRWGSGILSLSFHLITFAVLAVYRGLKWPFTGSFDLERISGRPAWQSVLGRTLAWAAVIAVGAALQIIALWLHLDRFGALYPELFFDGVERVARMELWTSGSGFLTILALGVGLYVLALTVTLWCKSGRFRHRAAMANAAVITILAGFLFWVFLRGRPLDLVGLVGLGVILIGLPVSVWLLVYKVE